jgi:hypothetical protein
MLRNSTHIHTSAGNGLVLVGVVAIIIVRVVVAIAS